MSAILRLLRVLPAHGDTLHEVVGRIDWEDLVRDAGRHGLAGVLVHAMESASIEIPPPHGEALRQQSLETALVTFRTKTLLLQVLDAMATAVATPILLKGYGLGLRLYPDPLLRAASDVDLLASPEEFPLAVSALSVQGFRKVIDGMTADKRKNHHPRFQGHHQTYVGPKGTVELHWRPISAFSSAMGAVDVFARCREDWLEGRRVRYLGLEDEVVYLALHAAKHLFHRISWLYDLKLLIRSQPSLNWDRVSEIAREAEMEGPTYFALEAAQRTMDANVPPRILATLKPASWQRAIGRHIFSEQQLTSSAYAERRHFRYLLRALLASSSETMAAEALSLSRQALQRIFEHHLPGWFRSLLPSTNSLPASHDKIGSRW